MPIETLSGALDALCAVEPERLGDAETVVALHRELERLAAVTTRAVAAGPGAAAGRRAHAGHGGGLRPRRGAAGGADGVAHRQVVVSGELARWLGEAWVERVVFEGPGR